LAKAQEVTVKSTVVAVRLSPPLVEKLDRLCLASVQRRADMLRLLIAKASLDDLPKAWRDLSPDERELLRESR
jgi:hypothetical protein